MFFKINGNYASLNAQLSINLHSKNVSTSLERLSSGLRINSAKDDASSMQIADRLKSDANQSLQEINNLNDEVGIFQIADKAMDEQAKIVTAIKTKATQMASDSQSTQSFNALRQDVNRLMESLDNISNTTSFNGKKLLSGSFTSRHDLNIPSTNSSKIGHITVKTSDTVTRGATTSVVVKNGNDTYTLESVDVGYKNGAGLGQLVDTINKNSDKLGIKAKYTVETKGSSAIAAGDISNLIINDVTIGSINNIEANDSDGRLINAINQSSNQTGVSASIDISGKLVLHSNDGRGIKVNQSGILNIGTLENYGTIEVIKQGGAQIDISDTAGLLSFSQDSRSYVLKDFEKNFTYSLAQGSSASSSSTSSSTISLSTASDMPTPISVRFTLSPDGSKVFAATQSGLEIYDPNNPGTTIGTYASGSTISDIQISNDGTKAYLLGDGNLEVLNISDLNNITRIGLVSLSSQSGYSNLHLSSDGSKLFVQNTNTLSTFSVSNPSSPSQISTYSLPSGNIKSISYSNNDNSAVVVSTTGSSDSTMTILNLSNPANITISGQKTFSSTDQIQGAGMTPDGSSVYGIIADTNGLNSPKIVQYNISNPSSIQEVDSVNFDNYGIPQAMMNFEFSNDGASMYFSGLTTTAYAVNLQDLSIAKMSSPEGNPSPVVTDVYYSNTTNQFYASYTDFYIRHASVTIAGSSSQGGGQVSSDGKSLLYSRMEQANYLMDTADSALKELDIIRSDIGSVQKMLTSDVNNLMVKVVNLNAAVSVLKDVDFAEESANFTKENILVQSGSFALSQANQVQQKMISSLLQS